MKKLLKNKIDIKDRDFLISLREECERTAAIPGTNPTWVRTFLELASAADHLDGMIARCTADIGTGRKPIKVVLIDPTNKGDK